MSQVQIRGRWLPSSSLDKRLCWFPVWCDTLLQTWHGCKGRTGVPRAGVVCGRAGLQSCCGGQVPLCPLPRDCWVKPIFGCFFCCKRMKTTKLLCTVTSFAKWCCGCDKGAPGHSPCGWHCSDTVWAGSCTSFVLMGFPSRGCYFNLQQCKFKPDLA